MEHYKSRVFPQLITFFATDEGYLAKTGIAEIINTTDFPCEEPTNLVEL